MKLFTLLFLFFLSTIISAEVRSFKIDYRNNQFLKDGLPFRYISGAFHYFRTPAVSWRDRMTKMRNGGLNALQSLVVWNIHELEPGVYDFTGDKNLFEFLDIANQLGLAVILRPGPYIDSERDFGGFPYWLLKINPKIQTRTMDPTYIKAVDNWYSVLLPKLVPYLYKNGGPIISFQVENEYGAFYCDYEYPAHLRDLFRSYLGEDVVLFTVDNCNDQFLGCGKIDTVLSTVDFTAENDPEVCFQLQHRHQLFGPSVITEYYPGWVDTWGLRRNLVNQTKFLETFDKILSLNASVNIYIYVGGTNFGLVTGSYYTNQNFQPHVTSYDYSSPVSEGGDVKPLYLQIRNVISKYTPLPPAPTPVPEPKMALGPVLMKPMKSLFDFKSMIEPVASTFPMTFEQLSQRDGFVLYSATVNHQPNDPAILQINSLWDRAQVYVDENFQGILSRSEKVFSLPLFNVRFGSKLDILVENQGRVHTGPVLGELKGISENVTLDNAVITNWNHYKIFQDWDKTISQIESDFNNTKFKRVSNEMPTVFTSLFQLPNDKHLPLDTFFQPDGWRKGIAFLNDFCLGRYWPVVGPQVTLYAPKHLFRPYPEINYLTVFELEGSPCDTQQQCSLKFDKIAVLNGTTPTLIH